MNEGAIEAATEVMHERGHWRVDDEDMKAALAAALPRAREEIARLIEKLRNSDDLNDQQITFACAEAADALSSTAGQEWLAFDPAKLSDSELILCLEEMRRRDAAAQTIAEPLLAEKQTETKP